MAMPECHGRFLPAALAAFALMALVFSPMAFVHGPSSRHALKTAAFSNVKGNHAQQQESGLTKTGSKRKAEQTDWLANCQTLLVGAALGLIVGSAGLSYPSSAMDPAPKPDKYNYNCTYSWEPGCKIEEYFPGTPKYMVPPSEAEVAVKSKGYLGCLLENGGSVSKCTGKFGL
eukprot:CAMPEP_0172662250 /NCGR_PEP_ID=MMETSP1074-20121228/5245_1 /TAXON_ID=2916 /ORGANISM="Ceratium fusus, Strain PA161109" /LENGTH=172 /DNA_ID=CAMNT_0013478145 /DNA_START=69 /DNA_END=587 /DNA_ORIENTATION=+